jgi:predicted helicase
MSIQIIQRYYAEVEKIKRYSGASNESSLRKPFQDLLEQYARAKGLVVVAEVEMESKKGTRIRPDGVLKDALRQDWGYWESKDEKDDIEAEIKAKFNKGYPNFNILFEDTNTAILYQGGERILEAAFSDAKSLDALLSRFVGYEPKEVSEFHKAIELFSAEVGGLAEVLRAVISEQVSSNQAFSEALNQFLELAQKAINPKIELADVREMIIQHVLTEDIFMRVFDEAEFHRENVIAQKLAEVSGTFYKGDTKKNILARIKPYYETINARASQISDHHEKQKFLKALYESFYKAYNPKAADRLGIVYTPDEIVHFMIESADHLTYKYFGKTLGDKGVEILDPATGTGTFITELIEYLPANQLEYKYDHELHCNEVSILPYYIANLNIEYTYKQKMGKFNEFENICFVDTLDNMGFEHTGKQMNFFGLTDENSERIAKQNAKPIMLVIGNPPYNANQANENENNKNREYPEIDARIKDTYIYESTAQKSKVYDMYARFYRWASDRLDKNGIIAFITNSSFLDSKTFDGFRKIVSDEFSHIYVVDLGGNVRKNPKLSGTTNNVFGIQTGVAIAFFVKTEKKGKTPAQIFYTRRPEMELATEKLDYLRSTKISEIKFENIRPDKQNNWLNLAENNWDDLIPISTKEGKAEKGIKEPKTIFKNFSLGVATNRDEWVYDESPENLEKKIKYFFGLFENEKNRWAQSDKKKAINDFVDRSIKWTSELEAHLKRGTKLDFSKNKITSAMYRPFVKRPFYYDMVIIHRPYQQPNFFQIGEKPNNIAICVNMNGKEFNTLSVNSVPDLHFNGDSQTFPLYRYIPRPDRSSSAPESGESTARKGTKIGQDDSGDLSGLNTSGLERVENITDWALAQFKRKYEDGRMKDEKKSKKDSSFITHPSSLTKEDIFHYVYAVLHHPAYRAKYEINLKREFPRIPFYEDFHQWAGWGKRLMELHLNYETVNPYPLQTSEVSKTSEVLPTTRLIARKEKGEIEIDSQTTLKGVPAEAWDYRLGTYSALEWVLERYKEKKPKDPTIAEKFNTYRFADYKEQVIELLGRVCTVSVETMRIVREMPGG